jgi:hypothetical protein
MPINADEVEWDEPIDSESVDWDYTEDMFPPNLKIISSILNNGKVIKRKITVAEAIQEIDDNRKFIEALTEFRESLT